MLLRHGTTGETTRSSFPAVNGADAEDPGAQLDDGGRLAVAALRPHLPVVDHVWSSHAARAVQTATLAARDPDVRRGDLAEADFGRWAGRVVAEVHDEEPETLSAWMLDPREGPPGGEPFKAVQQRARMVMQEVCRMQGTVLAATHGGFIRAALTVVLGTGARSAWRLDVAPASISVLAVQPGEHDSWQVRTVGWQPGLVVG